MSREIANRLEMDGKYVYPGQLSAIAYCIVKKYDNLEASIEKDELQPSCFIPSALSDEDIPGAGGSVYAAIDMLRRLKLGNTEGAWALEEQDWDIEEKSFDKDGAGRKAIPELREMLKTALKEKWNWTV